MHLKHGYFMLLYFIHGYYCIYRPWQPLTYLYFPYCISLIYFSFTKIRMFLYARIYWLAEFGDVSCLQFNYLRVETLISESGDSHSHSDLGGFCRVNRQNVTGQKVPIYIFYPGGQKVTICIHLDSCMVCR